MKGFFGRLLIPPSGMPNSCLHSGHAAVSPGCLSLHQMLMHLKQYECMQGNDLGSEKISEQIEHSTVLSIFLTPAAAAMVK